MKGLCCVLATLAVSVLPSVASAADLPAPSISTDVASVEPTGGQVVVTLTSTPADSCTIRVTPSLPGWPITVSPCAGVITRNAVIPTDKDTADRTYSFKAKVASGAGYVTTDTSVVTQQHRIRVAAFGDSLMYEAGTAMTGIVHRARAAPLALTAFPGTSMCGLIPSIKSVSATMHPDLVIIELMGTAFIPCAQKHTFGSPEWIADYRASTTKAVDAVLAGDPRSRVELVDAPTHDGLISGLTDIAAIYQEVAALNPTRVSYVNAGLSVEGPGGSWVKSLPCLAVEKSLGLCAGGRFVTNVKIGGAWVREIVVRSPQGSHFCPQNWPEGYWPPPGCSTYSSGAYRYSAAMLIPGMQAFGLGPLPDLSL